MKKVILTIIIFLLLLSSLVLIRFVSNSSSIRYQTEANVLKAIELPTPFEASHIKTPDQVKAIYMSSWVAGNVKLRNKLIDLIDNTELNAVVLDIKDYTGRVSFLTSNEKISKYGSPQNRIPDIKEFLEYLHKKNIYIIGRISVFQDSHLVIKNPEYAVKNKKGSVWKDRKGVSWIDAGAKPVWQYIADIGDEAYYVGFDELNFDYIRFPSDGDMKDIYFPYSEGKSKSQALNEFFEFIGAYFKNKNIPTSADLFGMTTTNTDDLGIGQILENALKNFDFVSPMVYPSHYPKGFIGFEVPASKPYEVIKFTMEKGVERAVKATTSPLKLRPWLQDFSIGKTEYTPKMVRDQIQATYDVGLNSWMLWNASNVYTTSALEK